MRRNKTKMKRIAASVVAFLIILAMLMGLILPFVYGAELLVPGAICLL